MAGGSWCEVSEWLCYDIVPGVTVWYCLCLWLAVWAQCIVVEVARIHCHLGIQSFPGQCHLIIGVKLRNGIQRQMLDRHGVVGRITADQVCHYYRDFSTDVIRELVSHAVYPQLTFSLSMRCAQWWLVVCMVGLVCSMTVGLDWCHFWWHLYQTSNKCERSTFRFLLCPCLAWHILCPVVLVNSLFSSSDMCLTVQDMRAYGWCK